MGTCHQSIELAVWLPEEEPPTSFFSVDRIEDVFDFVPPREKLMVRLKKATANFFYDVRSAAQEWWWDVKPR